MGSMDPTGLFGGGGSSSDASDAANIQAQYQQDALDYMKQTQELPLQYRDMALGQLGDYYSGDPATQQAMMNKVLQQPGYQSQLDAATQSTLGAASVTGVRGGSSQEAVSKLAPQLQQSYLNQQLSGLSSMAGMPIDTSGVASMTQNIGSTYAQGIMGDAQASQSQQGQMMNMGMQGLGMAGQMGWL